MVPGLCASCAHSAGAAFADLFRVRHFIVERLGLPLFTVRKSGCSKQAIAVNVLAWNNGIGLGLVSLVC